MPISTTRRAFLRHGTAIAALALDSPAQQSGQTVPWYRRAYRWGQTNITEKDPVRYDVGWWRGFWKRTEVQAVIINAGGIVAYYPSKYPLHHRAEFLNGRDLFGELTKAAHEDGIFVMARMDSNRTAEDFFRAHPDWFTRDRKGEPYRAADRYITCINSPYYDEYLPDVLREIAGWSKPDGFTDNSWAGLGRDSICYCENCVRKFRKKTGSDLPREANWDDPAYRKWILWNYERRTEVWELNNRTTRAAGGPDCIWSGMMSGSVTGLARSFRDLREVSRRPTSSCSTISAATTIRGSSKTATQGSASTVCSAGTSWRRRAWRCTSRVPDTIGWRASQRPKRACGCSRGSPAAYNRGGTTSARTTKIGACTTLPGQ